MSEFVDTNIFVRLLTGDDPGKAERCLTLLQRAQRGDVSLVTSKSVIAEITFVLSSRATYEMPRMMVATALRPVLVNPGLRVKHKGSILRALDIWEGSNLGVEDFLSIERIRRTGLDGIYSYDGDFKGVPDIRRLEP